MYTELNKHQLKKGLDTTYLESTPPRTKDYEYLTRVLEVRRGDCYHEDMSFTYNGYDISITRVREGDAYHLYICKEGERLFAIRGFAPLDDCLRLVKDFVNSQPLEKAVSYEIGQVPQKTGLKKVAEGVWVDPKTGKKVKGGAKEEKLPFKPTKEDFNRGYKIVKQDDSFDQIYYVDEKTNQFYKPKSAVAKKDGSGIRNEMKIKPIEKKEGLKPGEKRYEVKNKVYDEDGEVKEKPKRGEVKQEEKKPLPPEKINEYATRAPLQALERATTEATDPKGKRSQLKRKVKAWSKKQQRFYMSGALKSNSEQRKSVGELIKKKGTGLIKGLKHEVHEWSAAMAGISKAIGISKGEVDEHEKKAMKSVGIHLGITIGMMALTGGVGLASKGILSLSKGIVMHFFEHALLMNVGHAAIFAKSKEENGPMFDVDEVDEEKVMKELLVMLQKYIEENDFSEEEWVEIGEKSKHEFDLLEDNEEEESEDTNPKNSEEDKD